MKDKRRVNQIEGESDDSDDYVFGVNGRSFSKSAKIDVIVGGVCMHAVIDSGASCNIIDSCSWEDMKKKHVKCLSMTTRRNG